jgi:glucokinase
MSAPVRAHVARVDVSKPTSAAIAGSLEQIHAGHLEEAAARGDEYAQALWAEVGPLLGVTIANAVTLLNPSHVVLGGGVLSRAPVLKTYVTTAFEVAVNPPAGESVQIVDALLGDDAGLVGSALLAMQDPPNQNV